MLLLSTVVDEDRRAKILADVEGAISSGEGSIVHNGDWGIRPMTYRIQHQENAAGLERTQLDVKRGHFLGEGLGESPHRPLGGVVSGAAGKGQATAHRRYLKDAATLLLPHDR